MIFFLETAAFLQLTLMPGLLIMGLVRPEIGKFRKFLLIPGLSLLLNYIFVGLALICRSFFPAVSLVYTALVWVSVFWICRREIRNFFTGNFWESWHKHLSSYFENIRQIYCERSSAAGKTGVSLVLAGCAAGIFWFAGYWLSNWNGIFLIWDSALSWNAWAVSWMGQQIPANIRYYPQLLPFNWALSYQIIGADLSFAAKFSITVFPLLTGLFFIDYGLKKRNIPMLLSVPLLAFFIANVDYPSHGGELDLLIIYYSAALFFIIRYMQEAKNIPQFFRTFFLAVITVSSAAALKQSGGYLIFAAVLLSFSVVRSKVRELDISGKQLRNFLIIALLCIIIIAVPFYIFASYRIKNGMDNSNFSFVTEDIYRGRSYFDRFLFSCRLFMLDMQGGQSGIASAKWAVLDKSRGLLVGLVKLYYIHIALGVVLLFFNCCVLWYNFKKRRENPFLLFTTVIFFLIWSIFFCYDLRNLSLAIPWIALLNASTINGFFESKYGKKVQNMKHWQIFLSAVVIFILFMPETFFGNRGALFASKKREIGYPELNRMIYSSLEGRKGKSMIITDYAYGELISGIDRHIINCTFMSGEEFVKFLNDPDNYAIMIPSYADKSIHEIVNKMLEDGKLKRKFNYQEYTFYEIDDRSDQHGQVQNEI